MTTGRGSLSSLRELNRLRVLDVLQERGTASRADLARHTGLARSTVSSIVGELRDSGLVVEQEDARENAPSSGGRPPVMLSFDPGAGAVVGIQFDHGCVRAAVADLSLKILAESEIELDVDHGGSVGLDVAATLAAEVLEHAGADAGRVLGAGVGLAGPIDRESGVVGSTVLPGWAGLRVVEDLSRRLGMPVHIDNDANLGALAESVLGAGRGAADMAYIMLSSGIGGGLILGGSLYRGASGTAGEIGHVLVDESGPMCRCGNRGCLETQVGAAALLELLRPSHRDITFERMVALAAAGDPACRRAVGDAGATIGSVVAALCNQFNPRRIVVGGALVRTGDLLLEPLRAAVRRYAIPAAVEHLEIVPGSLGERAELLGALALAVSSLERALPAPLRAAARGVMPAT